jgi:hypothetical protein
MGPYKLGLGLNEVLELLPDGPRVELLDVEGLFDYRLMRSENGKLMVGVNSAGKVEFVAALDASIARTTEGGIGVGATRTELEQAFGQPSERVGRPHDPRILEFARLPNTRFVLEGGRVQGVLVGAQMAPEGERTASACGAAGAAGNEHALREIAKLPQGVVQLACFAGVHGALVTQGEQVAVVVDDGNRPRRLEVDLTPGMTIAAPLDCDGDGNQEVVLVAHQRSEAKVAARVRVFRVEGNPAKMSSALDSELYHLSSSAAFSIGARLQDTDLLLELAPGSGSIRVAGLYLQRGLDGTVRNLVPVEEQVLALPRSKGAPERPGGDPGTGIAPEGSGTAAKGVGSRP